MEINKKKIEEYTKLAKSGDTLAQKQLGLILSKTGETLYDAIQWLQKAASTDPEAMYLLGRIFLKKLDNTEKAFFWYETAAKNGHINAMIDVGAFYLFGFQVKQDIEKAIQWYKKAAEKNSPVAYHNLGYLCFQDPELYDVALHYFEKAAELGYADSSYMLGIMFLYGIGTDKNKNAAYEHFLSSYEKGKHATCRALGDLFYQGAFDNGVQNQKEALKWYERGAKKQVISCIEALGDCYYYGFGVEIDLLFAYQYYKQAAELGSAVAAFALGSMYSGGKGVKKNYREAMKWMLIAQNRQHPKAKEFVSLLQDIVNSNGPSPVQVGAGGSTGVHLHSSYSADIEAIEAQQKAKIIADKKRNASIYAAAGALSGGGSYTDYEMGAVISADGEISYVDTDLGIILGSDGSVASHDSKTGMTYNWDTGNMLAYDETFGATVNLKSGKISYNFDGYTMN